MRYVIPFLAIVAILFGACGDEEVFTGPILPDGEWVRIFTFACPEDAQTDDDCTIAVELGDTLTAGSIYVQEHHFINSEYLFGVLSWPLIPNRGCDNVNSGGRCVVFDVWGVFPAEHGVQRLVFKLSDPITYRLDYALMFGGAVLADTSFAWPVRAAPPPPEGPPAASPPLLSAAGKGVLLGR
ncbi:MAG: hypothetical protein JSU87_10970 [Gemmatimonadota bacterium]|nr:MAG: hypothetical protein JSU87_10970 [Gemmatimonadota bacterium]